MIRSFRHKGLKLFYEDDNQRGVNGQHREKLRDILARLEVAATAADMDFPGFRLHSMKGDLSRRFLIGCLQRPPLEHVAVLIAHPKNRHTIAGFRLVSVDELVKEISAKVVECGSAAGNAIPEQYPLLRTLQLSHAGYYKVCD